MSDFVTGHMAVAAAIKAAQPLPTAHAEIVQLVADHVRIDPAGTVEIVEADGSPALDSANGFAPLSPAAFMKTLQASRPWLFNANAKPQRTAASPPASPKQNGTITELMIAAKRGDANAIATLNDRLK